MSHASVKLLLHDVAKSLADNVQFGYGRRSEFNMDEKKRYPFIWLLPLTASRRFTGTNNPTKTRTWNVNLVFMDQDRADANEKESEKILDKQFDWLDKYMQALDDWYERSYDTIGAFTVQNDNATPFYKDDADIHTGWLLSFQIIVPDDYTYCTPENVSLYAGDI